MTNILMESLKNNYPNIRGIQFRDIYGYPPPNGCERIYFLFIHRNYLQNKNNIITPEQIKDIATSVFQDIGWEFYGEKGLMRNLIKFYNKERELNKKFKYQSYYDEHDIEFGDLELQLNFVISTGNRGRAKLDPVQRAHYQNFISEIIKQTMKNTE